MSKEDIKIEMIKVLDNFSDQALNELLIFLKELDKDPRPLYNQESLLKVLEEDKVLLQKLAQ